MITMPGADYREVAVESYEGEEEGYEEEALTGTGWTCRCFHSLQSYIPNPRNPITWSEDDWGVRSPPKRKVFHYHSQKVEPGSLGKCIQTCFLVTTAFFVLCSFSSFIICGSSGFLNF